MAPLSSTLASKIPRTEEPGRLQSMGSLRVGHNWVTSLSRIGEGNGNPLQCSCLENPRDGGLPSMGSHRVGHNWSDLAAAAVGDGIPGCNAPIGFIDALTFLRSVKRHHLLNFFFITKIGKFQGEQDASICFNSNCVSISSLAACNFSFVRGHCSVQLGLSFFQVILIIVLFLKWAVAPRKNVEYIYLNLPLHK